MVEIATFTDHTARDENMVQPHGHFLRETLLGSVTVLTVNMLSAANLCAQEVGLEEIVVTARKRDEDIQKTPVAVTAFSKDALETRQVTTVADVGKFVPNMSFQSGAALSGSNSSVTVFIRGIGQTDFDLTIDPGVGIYVDGVYVSRTTGALLDTTDI